MGSTVGLLIFGNSYIPRLLPQGQAGLMAAAPSQNKICFLNRWICDLQDARRELQRELSVQKRVFHMLWAVEATDVGPPDGAR